MSECRCGLSVSRLDNLLFSSFRSWVGTWGGGLVFFVQVYQFSFSFTSFGNFKLDAHLLDIKGISLAEPLHLHHVQLVEACTNPTLSTLWLEWFFIQSENITYMHSPCCFDCTSHTQVADCHIYPCIDVVCAFTMTIIIIRTYTMCEW